MAGPVRHRSIARLVLAVLLATASLGSIASSSPDATASALSRWTGGIDLYRSGVFTTQKTWLWCTAADVQIIRNIASSWPLSSPARESGLRSGVDGRMAS